MQPASHKSLTAPAPLPLGNSQELVSDALLARYAELIYKRTGVRISPQKKILLSNRVRRRLRATGIADFESYLRRLERLSAFDPEWDAFLQEITTHETYLFRDEVHWQWLRRDFLPRCLTELKARGRRKLRIWSAAASTGDEAASMACCAAAVSADAAANIEILATDIGVGALEMARAGVFNERSMRLVAAEDKQRFFTKATEANLWQLKPALLKLVEFKQHNLMERLRAEPFDVVFVKNVLIYFDMESKKQALGHVKELVRPQGYLVAGAAEGITDLMRDFQREQPWLFRNPRAE